MQMKNWLVVLGALSLGFAVPACSTDASDGDGDGNGGGGGTGGAECTVDSDYGCAGASQDEVREVITGPAARSTNAEAWAATNKWDAKTPEAGVAWEANSGLTWEQKYEKWMASMKQVRGRDYDTVELKTPQGRTLGSAVLECADQAIFFRFTFAAWYHLPFYMSGWVNGQNAYFGHFGVVDRSGNPLSGFPTYKTRYRDYESTWREGQAWPKDDSLRARNAGYPDSHTGILVDGNPLPEGARFGAYLDEAFLNKRAAHLLTVMVAYFGSANLADGNNTYHAKQVRSGQALVERWQKNGIGHTLPVYRVTQNEDQTLMVEGLQGSMPAHEAEYLAPQRYHSIFSYDACGGEGQTWDDPPVPYVKLGGGLKAWRSATNIDGRWANIVPTNDRANYIEDTDYAGLLERWNKWSTVLSTGSPERAYEIAIENLEAAREKLRNKPASCSSRTLRESSWTQAIRAGQALGKSEAEVRAENANDEDFIFAELIYNQSKTCCWLKPGPEQYEVIKDYFNKEKAAAEANGQCVNPTPFRLTNGSYDIWKNHAATIGKTWLNWTQDESPCPAANSNGSDPLTDNGEREYVCEDEANND